MKGAIALAFAIDIFYNYIISISLIETTKPVKLPGSVSTATKPVTIIMLLTLEQKEQHMSECMRGSFPK